MEILIMNKIGVYQIRSKKTNKFYIGSSANLTKRKERHFRSLRLGNHHNELLQVHYNKYGESDLDFIVLKYFNDRKRALALEDKLIKKYCTNKRCFNIGTQAIGGDNLSLNPNRDSIVRKITDSVHDRIDKMSAKERKAKFGRSGSQNGMYGKTHTAEVKKRLSETHKGNTYALGKKRSQATKKKLSEIALQRVSAPDYVNPFAGKRHSKKTRDHLSQKMYERIANGYVPPNARKVKIGKTVYKTISSASKALGCCSATILYRINSKNYPDYHYVNA